MELSYVNEIIPFYSNRLSHRHYICNNNNNKWTCAYRNARSTCIQRGSINKCDQLEQPSAIFYNTGTVFACSERKFSSSTDIKSKVHGQLLGVKFQNSAPTQQSFCQKVERSCQKLRRIRGTDLSRAIPTYRAPSSSRPPEVAEAAPSYARKFKRIVAMK